MWIAKQHTPPGHRNVHDSAEEEEEDELEQASFHGNILRHIFPLPATFGATSSEVAAEVVGSSWALHGRQRTP